MPEPENPLSSSPLIPAENQTEPQPESSPVETLENETNESEASTAQSGIVEKIRRAGNAVAEKFNVVRKGRGRPKKDGSPKISDVVEPENHNANPGAAAPVDSLPAAPEISPDPVSVYRAEIDELFRRCLASSAKGATQGLNVVTKLFADQAGIDPAFTEKALEKAKPEPDALEDFSSAVNLAVKIHAPSVQKNGEKVCLMMASARLVAPYALLWWEFKKEIDRKNKTGA